MRKKKPAPAAIAAPLPLTMTAREVALELRIGRRTLDTLIKTGAVPGPHVRLTRKTVRWRRDAIEALIAAGGAASARTT